MRTAENPAVTQMLSLHVLISNLPARSSPEVHRKFTGRRWMGIPDRARHPSQNSLRHPQSCTAFSPTVQHFWLLDHRKCKTVHKFARTSGKREKKGPSRDTFHRKFTGSLPEERGREGGERERRREGERERERERQTEEPKVLYCRRRRCATLKMF